MIEYLESNIFGHFSNDFSVTKYVYLPGGKLLVLIRFKQASLNGFHQQGCKSGGWCKVVINVPSR